MSPRPCTALLPPRLARAALLPPRLARLARAALLPPRLARAALVVIMALLALPARAETAAGTRSADPLAPQDLAGHAAIYQASLLNTAAGSSVNGVSGQVAFEWQPVCDGFESRQKVNLTYTSIDGEPRRQLSDFVGLETADGLTYAFTVRENRLEEDALVERFVGSALRGSPDGDGIALYDQPPGVEFPLSADAQFPTGFILGLLNAARSGKRIYSALLFDGSDGSGPLRATAVITPLRQRPAMIDSPLTQAPGWRVRAAFYPVLGSSDVPEYEMVLSLLENGVIGDADLIYPELAVHLTMAAIRPLADGDCSLPGALPREAPAAPPAHGAPADGVLPAPQD